MEFRLLGPLQVVQDGLVVELGAPKMHALLTTLLLHANAVVSADRLIDDLWGDAPPATAAATLQTYVARLRRALEPDARTGPQRRIITRRPGYLIRVDRGELDIARFDELAVEGRRAVAASEWRGAADTLRQALALWRGPAVAEFAHEPFGQLEAARLEEARICALEDRIAADLALGAHVELVGELEALAGEQPFREKLRGQLMVALYRSGRQAEALRAYGAFRQILGEELGIEPSPELRRLEEAMLLQETEFDWPGAPPSAFSPSVPVSEAAPVVTPDGRPSTIPVQLTSYVTSEHVRTVQKLLSDTRLVTLTGTGGIGKTRLAMEVAAEVVDDFDDVRVVELAPVADPNLLVQQVLIALHTAEPPGQTVLGALVGWVATRRVLLVLDNCEHLLEATARLVDHLLSSCPRLRILVTSRERVRLPAETVWAVPPLSVPSSDGGQPIKTLADYDSVRLFLDRATAVKPDLQLSDQNASAVAEICRRLDGIPLALELAAARTSVLSLAELARRLDDRFRLLTQGSRVAPARHQTLRAAVNWTYEALSQTEKRVFYRGSVFAGGFDLAALEHVVAGHGIEETDVLDALSSLVDKSLVTHDDRNGRSRYGLLETLREYGAEKLAATGEEARVRALHLQWALSVAERANDALASSGRESWGEMFALDHDNFRAALAWVMSDVGGGDAVRLAIALSAFWDICGQYSEGRQWLERALASAPDAPPDLRAAAVHAAAGFAFAQADYLAAETLERESLASYEDRGDRRGQGHALGRLAALAIRQDRYDEGEAFARAGLAIARELSDNAMAAAMLDSLVDTAQSQGDFERARLLAEEILHLRRELGDQIHIAASMQGIAALAVHTGDYDAVESLCREAEAIARCHGATALLGAALLTRGAGATFQGRNGAARQLLEDSLVLAKQAGDHHNAAWCRQLLADVATADGDLASARRGYDGVLTVAGQLNDRYMTAWSLRGLSRVAWAEGDKRTARAYCTQAVVISDEIGHKPGVAGALETLAAMAAQDEDGARAARLLGAAERLRLETSNPVPGCHRDEYEETISLARAALDTDAWERLWAEGRAMDRTEYLAAAAAGIDQRCSHAKTGTGSR